MRIRAFGPFFPLAVALLMFTACGDPNEPSDQPAILLLNPRGVPSGLGPFQLHIYGENFGPGSTVYWNGEALPSASYSAKVVNASVPATRTATQGTVSITVSGPTGTRSRPATFLVGSEYLEPELTLTSVTPAQGTAGLGDLEVTANGTGFIEGTALFVDFNFLETTRINSTTLRASIPASYLQVNRTLELRLGIPDFWISGRSLAWEVQAAAPIITSLDPAGASAGSDDLPVRILGSGFVTGSVVMVNAIERATTFVSGSELRITLTSADLTSARTLALSVFTPPPGGGMSGTANFVISNEAPELAPLPLAGVTAGRPGFTLIVHGQHFTAGTVVQWNGSDRPTAFRSGRRLLATIPSADVGSPGQATITVRTPGFPATSPRTLTIHPVPSATLTNVKSVEIPARWLAVDTVTGRLFATIPGEVPTHGNTLAEIDPNAGAILTSVFVGSEPSVAEVSDDGQYVYVGLDGAQAVRRVSLPSLTAGLQFSLGSGLQAEELHVMPGRPQTVAVSRRSPGYSPSNSGLVIYDEGVPRGLTGPGHTGSNTFGWTRDGLSIFGYNFETTEFGLRRLNVGPEGATEVWVRSGLLDGFFYARIQVVGDQIYGGEGSVVDGDLQERLGSCSMAGRVAVDRTLGRAFYWSDNRIQACELATYQSLGELTIPGVVAPHPTERRNLTRWGNDGLAFSDGTRIYLVRTPLAAP